MDSKNTKTGDRGDVIEDTDVEFLAPMLDDVMEIERERSGSVCSKRSDTSAKRNRMADGDSDYMDDMSCVRMIGSKLRKYLFTESNQISKSASEFILNCASEYEEQMMRLLGKKEKLQGRLDECARRTESNVIGTKSYANASENKHESVVRSDVNVYRKVKERSHVVMIRVKDKNAKMTSEQVKDKVMRDVSKTLNVRVKAVRKIRSGGIAIETASENKLRKLVECGKFNEIGLKVEFPRKIGPKLIVYDVPNEMMNEEFMSEMYDKNLKGRVTLNEFKERVKIINRNSRKGAICGNVILEMSKRVKEIIYEEYIYMKKNVCL